MDSGNQFIGLQELRLAGNALQDLKVPEDIALSNLERIASVGLERNKFKDLDCLQDIIKFFPRLSTLSLQANQISQTGPLLSAAPHSFPSLRSLNLSDNKIESYLFFNSIPRLLPELVSLQMTNNPLFKQDVSLAADSSRASDKSFYLTLARLPTVQTLNYTNVNSRDRQEGELYYLSIAEKELRGLLANNTKLEALQRQVEELHPLYPALTKKHERESILNVTACTNDVVNGFSAPLQPIHPAGSLGARLVTATFYLKQASENKKNSDDLRHEIQKATITLPTSLPVKQLMSLLLRHPTFHRKIQPLQFNLIFESTEYDPVDTTTESTTRSAMYGMTAEQKRNLWKEWGNWDADVVVVHILREAENGKDTDIGVVVEEQEKWTEDGEFQIRDGRKWKRREVNIPHSLKRAWGDWLDDTREVTIRLEPSSQK